MPFLFQPFHNVRHGQLKGKNCKNSRLQTGINGCGSSNTTHILIHTKNLTLNFTADSQNVK